MSLTKPWWAPKIKRPEVKARTVWLSAGLAAAAETTLFIGADTTREWATWHVDGAKAAGSGVVWFVAEPVEAVIPCMVPVGIIHSVIDGNLRYNKDCVGDRADKVMDRIRGRSGVGQGTTDDGQVQPVAVDFMDRFEDAGFSCAEPKELTVVEGANPTTLMEQGGTSRATIEIAYGTSAFDGVGTLSVGETVRVASCVVPSSGTLG